MDVIVHTTEMMASSFRGIIQGEGPFRWRALAGSARELPGVACRVYAAMLGSLEISSVVSTLCVDEIIVVLQLHVSFFYFSKLVAYRLAIVLVIPIRKMHHR